MTVDIALGVAVPEHHVGDFAGKQNSLHAFVVKREGGEKAFPYLLGTHWPGGAVCVKNFHGVSERGPEILKSAKMMSSSVSLSCSYNAIQAASLVSSITRSSGDTRALARAVRVRAQRNSLKRQ
jgi:hypothetical protein